MPMGLKNRPLAGTTTPRTRCSSPCMRNASLLYQPRRYAKGTRSKSERWRQKISCASDRLVVTRRENRNIAVPLSQVKAIGMDESTTQAIEDWHYWIAQGNCF